jgi:hypothetical protein
MTDKSGNPSGVSDDLAALEAGLASGPEPPDADLSRIQRYARWARLTKALQPGAPAQPVEVTRENMAEIKHLALTAIHEKAKTEPFNPEAEAMFLKAVEALSDVTATAPTDETLGEGSDEASDEEPDGPTDNVDGSAGSADRSTGNAESEENIAS